MMRHSISVVCPAYNAAEFVVPTIQSVLGQTAPPLELIVSDDGSIDNTVELIEGMARNASCPVQILRNVHKGPGAARNAGIAVARGEWVAFLDSDDLWHHEKIAQVTRVIETLPTKNFFCHDVHHRLVDGKKERLRLARRYENMVIAKQLFRNCPFVTSAVVCRKDVLLEHGIFNEQLMSAQDFELWLRLSPHLKVHFIDEVLGQYTDRPGNISSKKRLRHLWNVLRALTYNRRNTKIKWYITGVMHHVAVFCKNQFIVIARKLH